MDAKLVDGYTYISFRMSGLSIISGFVQLTSLRSQILMTFLSALTTSPSPAIRCPPSIHNTFLSGNPYPWSFNANGRADRISYNSVCPLDVPTAYDNPSALDDMAVTDRPTAGAWSTPGRGFGAMGEVTGKSLLFGKRRMPTLVRERGSQNCTDPFRSTPKASN